MFIKVTASGPRRYVQLVEAYRDDQGRPKQRTVATLGRLDQLSAELESVISGLLRVTGRTLPEAPPQPTVHFESARAYGDVWALTELWHALGFDQLRRIFRRTRHSVDIEALVRVMVFNWLCDPDSKLDAQDNGKHKRGRKLSDGGARARFYHEVCEAHLTRIIRVDLKSALFTYDIDEAALTHARMMDGKLLLVTNTTDLTPDDVVKRYKSLADIERGFRVLKSEIEIGPIYHRLPDRIRAHAAICFMALILYRVMRSRLHAGDTSLSPERALSTLRRIQHHRVTLNGAQPATGISSISKEQTDILSALTIKKPTLNTQLTLL